MSRGSIRQRGTASRSNALEYVIPRKQQRVPILFHKDCSEEMHTITHSQFEKLCSYLENI